jgi:ribonuclease P protein component
MTVSSRGRAEPGRLTRRSEFIAAAKGRRFHTSLVSIQGIERPAETSGADFARFGLTVSRKVGTATERNRVKRRLRAALECLPAGAARLGHDYVIVARRDILGAPFDSLIATIGDAIAGLDRPRRPTRPHPSRSETR